MGINREALKEKIKRMRDPSSRFGDSDLWRPDQEGNLETVRFLDNPFTDDDPFIQLFFHYRIGKGRHILCPRKNWGKTCPICEWAKSIVNNNPEDKELARDLWPKQRFFGVIVDRKDPTLTPKYYGFGQKNYFQLIDKLHNAEYRDYMDPLKGIDVTVKCQKEMGETGKPQMYPTTTFDFSRRDTRLADTDEKIQEILNKIKRIDEIFKPMTVAEIKERLNEWLQWQEGDPLAEGEETRGVNEPEDSFEEDEKEPVSVEEINAEFEKALSESEATA